MNKWQEYVTDFHYKFGCPIRTNSDPQWSQPELRKSLIKEECAEMCEAIDRRDIAETVDGACDLIYVILGTMIELGIDLDPFFIEVHKTNMAKSVGKFRNDGKILKPDGWKPPRIAEMIANKEGQAR